MSDLQQPDDDRTRQTLDELYEDLAEVQAHAHTHDQEREQLQGEVEKMVQDLTDQRDAAAAAGERATYQQLSQDLATLHRAWQALQEDPDGDPLEEYQPDDSEPADQPPDEKETDDDPERGTNRSLQAGPVRHPGAAGSAEPGEPPEPPDGGRGLPDADHQDLHGQPD